MKRNTLVVAAILWALSVGFVLAQDAPPPDVASSSVAIPPTEGFVETFFSSLITQGAPLGAAVAGLVVAGLLALLTRWRIELGKLRERYIDPLHGKLPHLDQYAVNAMVVGLGGSGKTSIIRSLSACEEADPEIKTAVNQTYTIVNEVSVKGKGGELYRRVNRIYIDEHVGQQMASIFDTDMARRRGLDKINRCLIIVVDLFEVTDSDNRPLTRTAFDKRRIAKNLNLYNEGFVQILTTFLNDGDKFVVFINKIDGLQDITEQAVEEAKAAYKPLIDRLRAVNGRKTMVVVGSAMRGLGLVSSDASGAPHSLLSILVRSASKMDG